ncbi:putative ADP-ribosylation factor GTPase-activating protein AGD12 [Paratrimastix pyriformis]|uniref:ADP-ribosylation factor GTPase-activating protein AGD12 n=1 Tax=Paratrimastix pyriformis TaxID=342808 RepID=A0ABQ8UG11_9EUKA|nr:putative ADP-ribosylation factor GTPase-activating protein AGD12 [Paratrimastix pyriformis]
MSSAASPSQIQSQQAKLRRLVNCPGNDICAECGAPSPKWASCNLGVLVCLRCAGAHRSLSTQISMIRSLTLDRWTDEQIETVLSIGNDKANEIWEHSIPPGAKISMQSTPEETIAFVRRKYVDREWSIHSDNSDRNNANSTTPVPTFVPSTTQHIMVNQVQAGLLTIQLIEGVDLTPSDPNGLSDPYVIFTLGTEHNRSRTVQKSLSPRWDETINMRVPSRDLPLKMRCMDYDRTSRDDFLGEAALDLRTLQDGVPQNLWVALGRVDRGQLHMVLIYTALSE